MGRPAGSKNKSKEKTLENFGISRDSEVDKEMKIERITRVCKDETVSEMKNYLTIVMEEIRKEMRGKMEKIKEQMMEERKERPEERREREKWSKEKKCWREELRN